MKRMNAWREHMNIPFLGFLVMWLWIVGSLLVWLWPIESISLSERRTLAPFPKASLSEVLSGKFMDDFEVYSKDQFPMRFTFRKIKALARTKLFLQKDNAGIYLKDGYATKMEYPLKEGAIQEASKALYSLYTNYLKDGEHRIALAVIPDKNYYLAGDEYPAMDYDRLYEEMKEQHAFAKFIDLRDDLRIEDYYKSDIHWRQERLLPVAKRIAEALEIPDYRFEGKPLSAEQPFYGVYYGQAALPMEADELIYFMKEGWEDIRVYNLEKDAWGPVVDIEKIDGWDPYNIFLSGPAALLVAQNPHATTDRELIIFRDSFGSAFAPLLLDAYAQVTLIDTRYIAERLLGDYVDFSDQDVLFLYSTTILNSPGVFK